MIRVLVVEDESVAAAAHKAYVDRVPGFSVVGVARTAEAAAALLAKFPVDLILLDMNLPDMHGLELLRHLRARGRMCDVMAVTSSRDVDVLRRAMAQGVTHYVLKPFSFAALRARLLHYAAWRDEFVGKGDGICQSEVDRLFELRRAGGQHAGPPKGLSEETLSGITAHLSGTLEAQSASAVADAVGTSRVTARRYLEHLVESGSASRQSRHGNTGRPEVLYRWSGGR